MLPGQYVIHDGRPAQLSRTLNHHTVGAHGATVPGVKYELVQDGRYVYVTSYDREVKESAPARSAEQVGVSLGQPHPVMLPACKLDETPAGYPCDHLDQRAAQ